MFQDEIEKLVAETFSNLQNFSSAATSNFDFDFSDEGDEFELPQEVPGFFYHLQIQNSTFVVRILESDNLLRDYHQILQYPEDYPSLRLLDEEDGKAIVQKLKYFECDCLEIALAVKSHLSNRRYPKFEEHIYNVSDPIDSWWIKEAKNKITVYFKLSRTEQIEKLQKVGPLGDKELAVARLGQFYGYFNLLFPVEDFSCNPSSFSISTYDPENQNFKDLINIFTMGEVHHDFWLLLGNLELNAKREQVRQSIRIANYYMMELSVIRKFWREIQAQLI